MGALFGKSKKKEESRITEQDKAVLQLKQQRDKLKQYQKKITVQLEKERLLAKSLLSSGKREKALLLLKKKRYQENLMSKTDSQIDNIERMVQDLEYAQIEVQVVEGLKSGNDALKTLHRLMSLEDVEKIMDEAQEGIEYQREIDELLSGSLTAEDNDAVLAELDQIIQESLPEVEEREADEVPQLPGVPTQEPERKKIKEHRKQPELVAAS